MPHERRQQSTKTEKVEHLVPLISAAVVIAAVVAAFITWKVTVQSHVSEISLHVPYTIQSEQFVPRKEHEGMQIGIEKDISHINDNISDIKIQQAVNIHEMKVRYSKMDGKLDSITETLIKIERNGNGGTH